MPNNFILCINFGIALPRNFDEIAVVLEALNTSVANFNIEFPRINR